MSGDNAHGCGPDRSCSRVGSMKLFISLVTVVVRFGSVEFTEGRKEGRNEKKRKNDSLHKFQRCSTSPR